MEEVGNLAQSTLSTTLTSGTSTLSISDTSKFPNARQFHLLIDQEIVYVTNGAIYPFPILRGREGTTPAAHTAGTLVTLAFTNETFQLFGADNCEMGPFSGAVTAGFHGGRIHMSDDSLIWTLDYDAYIRHYGPFKKMTPFNVSDFSWMNQTYATFTNVNGTLYISSTVSAASDNLIFLKKPLPARPYSVAVYLAPMWDDRNYLAAGISLIESSTGKIESCLFNHRDNVSCALDMDKWNSYSSWNSNRGRMWVKNIPTVFHWIKMVHDGTTIKWFTSVTGIHWYELLSFAKNNFFTTDADQIALTLNTNAETGGYSVSTHVFSWEEGTG